MVIRPVAPKAVGLCQDQIEQKHTTCSKVGEVEQAENTTSSQDRPLPHSKIREEIEEHSSHGRAMNEVFNPIVVPRTTQPTGAMR
jgi:hypothetical protein